MQTVMLEICKRSPNGTLYDASHNGEIIVRSSRDPEHAAVRALLARGIYGPVQFETGGRARSSFRSIEAAAKWSVTDDDSGLHRRIYKPRPDLE